MDAQPKKKKARGKTRPLPVRIAEALDLQMNQILRGGVTALDKDGNVVKLTPSAAQLNAIRARLRDLERSGVETTPAKHRKTRKSEPAVGVGDFMEQSARMAESPTPTPADDADEDETIGLTAAERGRLGRFRLAGGAT